MRAITKLIKNEYIYSVINKMVMIAVGMMFSVFTARYLGTSFQGIYAYILSLIQIISIIITCGIHQVYPYLRKKYGKEKIYDKFLTMVFYLFLTCFLIAIVMVIFIQVHKFEIYISVLLSPIYGYCNVLSYVYLIESPNSRNNWETLSSILNVILILCMFLLMEKSRSSVVIILAFAECFKCIVYSMKLKVRIKFSFKLYTEIFYYLKLGFIPMLSLLLTVLNYKIDILMLKSFSFISMEQIGIYSIGILFADKIALIPDTLKGVLASKLSKGAGEKEVAKVCRLSFAASIAICIMIIILGKPVIDMLYGKEYAGAYDVMLICSFGTVFVGYYKLISQYNIIQNKQLRNLIFLVVTDIVNIILNLLLIPKLQLVGAAMASGISYLLIGVIIAVWFAKESEQPIREMIFVKCDDLKCLVRK